MANSGCPCFLFVLTIKITTTNPLIPVFLINSFSFIFAVVLGPWFGWLPCFSGGFSRMFLQSLPSGLFLIQALLSLQEHVFWVVSLNTLFILVFGE